MSGVVQDDARIIELTDMVDDLAGNLADAAETIQTVTQAVVGGQVNEDVEAYRQLVAKARRLV